MDFEILKALSPGILNLGFKPLGKASHTQLLNIKQSDGGTAGRSRYEPEAMLPCMTFRALKVSICPVTAFQKASGPGFRTKRPPFSGTFQ